MLDVAFTYNYEEGKWIRCTDTELAKKEIEDIPCVPLINYISNPYRPNTNSKFVFCPKHGVMERIESISNNRAVSENGCCFEGLLGFAEITIGYDGYYAISPGFAPFRWRIYQSAPLKYINIACDVLKVNADINHVVTKLMSFSLAVDIIKDKIFISKCKLPKSNINNWTETDIEIPDVVVETAMEAMRECTLYKTGIKPSVLCQIKNKTTLMAYLERPFDVNIVFLKQFFREFTTRDGEDIFDEVFTREEKNNYRIICDLLKIKPPKSLRKAYAFNPYAIVWYMIFKQWGIKDINYMHKFFYLDDSIASMYLKRFYFDKEANQVTRDYSLKNWEALEYYCHWVLEQKGEKRMLKWLYRVSLETGLNRLQWDALIAFHDYHEQLSEEVKARLLKDGPTVYVHDAISTEVTAFMENWRSTKINYNETEQSYSCRIKEYEFRLLPNTGMLPKLGAAFNNCVATYRDRIIRHQSVIVYVMNSDDYMACIEIKKGCHITQALGKYNSRLNREVNNVCYYWAKHSNLVIDVDDILPISPEELKEFDDVRVEPIYVKSVHEMSLEELKNIPENKICEGYYLRLEYLLSSSTICPAPVPSEMEFSDEISRLTFLLPEGEPIFKAAANGNSEAMMVLGLMYFKGHVIDRDFDQALKWLNMSADSGNKEAAKKAKQLQNYMETGITNRELEILDALSNLRRLLAAGAY